MTNEIKEIVIAVIGTAVPLLTVLGILIGKILDYRRRLRELDIAHHLKDERSALVKIDTDVGAAKQLSLILNDVIQPLALRVKALEEEAISRQSQISTLHKEIQDLQRIITQKDIEIMRLTHENEKQLRISIEQQKVIERQEQRITYLESKLNKDEKELKDGSISGNN